MLGRALVADAVVLMLPGILSLSGITLPNIEKDGHCMTLPLWPSFNVLPVLPIDRTFVQESSSHSSPVLKKGHTCGCQPVTIVRESFSSSQHPFLRRVRSMNSLSLADTSDLVSRSFFCC